MFLFLKIRGAELVIATKMIPLLQCEWIFQIVLYCLGLPRIEQEVREAHEQVWLNIFSSNLFKSGNLKFIYCSKTMVAAVEGIVLPL